MAKCVGLGVRTIFTDHFYDCVHGWIIRKKYYLDPTTNTKSIHCQLHKTHKSITTTTNQPQQQQQPQQHQQQSLFVKAPSSTTINLPPTAAVDTPPPLDVDDHDSPPQQTRSVSILVYKTLNSVFKNGRKVIIRACEVAGVRKARSCKMFNLYSTMKGRTEEPNGKSKELETTGHDRFCQSRPSR